MPAGGHTFAKLLLGARLVAYREAAQITTQQVHDAKVMSKSNLWRIETGLVSVSQANVRTLAAFYRIGDNELPELLHLADRTTRAGIWWPFRAVLPTWSYLYLDMEAYASAITIWQDGGIPAELQTGQYARACLSTRRPAPATDAIDAQVQARLHRRGALFERAAPPRLTVVLGEGALRRQVGDPDTMAGQLEYLRHLDQRAGVDIRYLPFTAGALPAVAAAFRVLSVTGPPALSWVYLETDTSGSYLDKPIDVTVYQSISDTLTSLATPIATFTS